jgi:hypothetical protein
VDRRSAQKGIRKGSLGGGSSSSRRAGASASGTSVIFGRVIGAWASSAWRARVAAISAAIEPPEVLVQAKPPPGTVWMTKNAKPFGLA